MQNTPAANTFPLADYIESRVDLLQAKAQEEYKQLKALNTFFQKTTKAINNFAKDFQKSIETLKGSCNESLQALIKVYEEIPKDLDSYLNLMNVNIIEELTSLLKHYESINTDSTKKLSHIVDSIHEQRSRILKLRKRYFEETRAAASSTTEEVGRAKFALAEECKEKYIQAIETLNSSIDSKKEEYDKTLEIWHKNEEYKNQHVKIVFEKFQDRSLKLFNKLITIYTNSSKIIEIFNPSVDIQQHIVIRSPPKIRIFKRILIEEPSINKKLPMANFNFLNEEDSMFLTEKVKELIKGQLLTSSDKERIKQLIRIDGGLSYICDELGLVQGRREIKSCEVFNELSNLALIILDKLEMIRPLKIDCFSGLIVFGEAISYMSPKVVDGKYKIYIRGTFSSHKAWRIKDLWSRLVSYRLNKKLSLYNLEEIPKENEDTEEKKFNKEEASRRGIIFNELSFIIMEMSFYSIDFTTVEEIILNICKTYNLESERVCQLLSDFEASCKFTREEDKKQTSPEQDFGKGCSKINLGIGLSIEYINDIRTLLSILLLNKKCFGSLKKRVYKQAVVIGGDKVRFSVWKSITYSDEFALLYTKLSIEVVDDFMSLRKYIDDTIKMDVRRSFHPAGEVVQASIINVLRRYAFFNNEIMYCQGMNCLAGFLYLIYKDEAISFSMFSKLINEFNLSELFKQNVPLLKTYFYQLNRLIALYLPNLHSHLFEEGTNSTYFASPWFLTAFTYVLQFNNNAKMPVLILKIFDDFLLDGVKAIHKTALFILEYHQEKILKTKYESISQFLATLPKTNFFADEEVAKVYDKIITRYDITNQLLNELDTEYNRICKVSNTQTFLPQTTT